MASGLQVDIYSRINAGNWATVETSQPDTFAKRGSHGWSPSISTTLYNPGIKLPGGYHRRRGRGK
jgi:hypothetical protein